MPYVPFDHYPRAAEVRRLRLAAGLTRLDLADATDVSVDTIKRWEQGRNRPHPKPLARLARALGVDVEDLQ